VDSRLFFVLCSIPPRNVPENIGESPYSHLVAISNYFIHNDLGQKFRQIKNWSFHKSFDKKELEKINFERTLAVPLYLASKRTICSSP
jgi:hypothetical protein